MPPRRPRAWLPKPQRTRLLTPPMLPPREAPVDEGAPAATQTDEEALAAALAEEAEEDVRDGGSRSG